MYSRTIDTPTSKCSSTLDTPTSGDPSTLDTPTSSYFSTLNTPTSGYSSTPMTEKQFSTLYLARARAKGFPVQTNHPVQFTSFMYSVTQIRKWLNFILSIRYGGKVEYCLLSVVCCLLSVVCCLMSVVCCLLSVICCMLSDVCCLLSVICYLLYVVCYLLAVICCLFFVVCYLLSVICYLQGCLDWCTQVHDRRSAASYRLGGRSPGSIQFQFLGNISIDYQRVGRGFN